MEKRIQVLHNVCRGLLGSSVSYEQVENELFLIENNKGVGDSTLNQVIRRLIKN